MELVLSGRPSPPKDRKVDFIKRIYGSIVLGGPNESSGNGVLIKPDSGETGMQAAWGTAGQGVEHKTGDKIVFSYTVESVGRVDTGMSLISGFRGLNVALLAAKLGKR